MTRGSSTVTFSIAEPHHTALRIVRRALEQQGLRTPAELNITARIKQELGAGLAPCVVLYVDEATLLLEAVVFQRGAALLIPQPVVVSGSNHHTEVLVRSAESLAAEDAPDGLRDPVFNLHARIVKAMESIAEREGAHLIASP
ncbi:MAG TPA: hypothetical protein VN428_05970 [Bryobacteraceae bacterium]|nr:hypothetical protein [Bryobacteraceae bacterium]